MSDQFGIDEEDFDKLDLHPHALGAIPRMAFGGCPDDHSLTSLLTGLPVDPTVAVSNEITLRGAVLPVGGVKEKVLAAHRAGIVRSARKCRDLVEVPDEIKEDLEFEFVSRMEEVVELALGKENLAKARKDLALRRQKRVAGSTAPTASA